MLAENLAENAIRYAGHGARVHALDPARRRRSRVLTAADDGGGVDAETLARLFERFYRGDAARTTRGTGLGLAIVKHIVAAAGGEVEADGARGRGLRIRCTFPLETQTTRGRHAGRPLRARASDGYVWIVFSVFSDATSTGFGSGTKRSFAVYCAFWPWVSAQKISFRSSAACDVCCGTITYV